MSPQLDSSEAFAGRRKLSAQLQSFRVRKGWNMDQLAATAGVSRTTVYHLERGDIANPRAATLYKLAVALDIDPQELIPGSTELPHAATTEQQQQNTEEQSSFDRKTNTYVKKVYSEFPDVFQGWIHDDWDQLYSTFGIGGPLNEQGVLAIAEQINTNRQAIQMLQVVLETHHAEVAVGLIENLYRLVQTEAESVASIAQPETEEGSTTSTRKTK